MDELNDKIYWLGIILTILFLTLRLCAVITWSWGLVFLPIIVTITLWILCNIVAKYANGR